MGPAFYIKLDILVNSFAGPQYRNLMRFTATNNNCCNGGDRIPAIWTRKDGLLYFTMKIDGNGNKIATHKAKINNWYSVELWQYLDVNQVYNSSKLIL